MNAQKRILVLSDSHGYSLSNLLMKAETLGRIDAVFHLGDGHRDMDRYLAEFPSVYRVIGNCDFCGGDREVLVPLFGKRFLLTHGHSKAAPMKRRRTARYSAIRTRHTMSTTAAGCT